MKSYACRTLKCPIGVLMGGVSPEREVSIHSGQAVCQALSQAGHKIIPVDINTTDSDKLKKIIKRAKIEVAFIALHGGQGEDGTIQSILESMGLAYTGSGPEACKLAMDKIKSRRVFEKHSIPVPDWEIYQPGNFENNGLGFPLVVKPSSQGSSVGLNIVRNIELLARAINDARQWGDEVILEKYLPGDEITVGILGEQSLPVVQIKPQNEFYDYQAKYEPGMCSYLVPAPLPEPVYKQAQELGLACHKVLGCRVFSRVDMIYTDRDEIVVLEVNTIPGLTSTSLLPKAARAKGISFEELCQQILRCSLEDR